MAERIDGREDETSPSPSTFQFFSLSHLGSSQVCRDPRTETLQGRGVRSRSIVRRESARNLKRRGTHLRVCIGRPVLLTTCSTVGCGTRSLHTPPNKGSPYSDVFFSPTTTIYSPFPHPYQPPPGPRLESTPWENRLPDTNDDEVAKSRPGPESLLRSRTLRPLHPFPVTT